MVVFQLAGFSFIVLLIGFIGILYIFYVLYYITYDIVVTHLECPARG